MQHIAIPEISGMSDDEAALFLGRLGAGPGQAVTLQQAVDGRARHAPLRHWPAGFQERLNLS